MRGSQPSTWIQADQSSRTIELQFAAAVIAKDRKATAEFVSRYADAIYTYVRRRLIPRMDLIDDIVQEVFLAGFDNLK